MPNGTPCGLEDGVPQICWAPHNGGFEGSPDLPTGYKPFTKPQPALPAPTMELELKPETVARHLAQIYRKLGIEPGGSLAPETKWSPA